LQNQKKRSLKTKREQQDKFVEEIVNATQQDFETRRKERLALERQWELNVNFLTGNQYFDVNGRGELVEQDKQFFWQTHRVFNHVAPVVETRLAKFSRISPTIFVRPPSNDDKQIESANAAQKFIEGVFKRSDLKKIVRKVTTWSECCGTGFYKIVWDNCAGQIVGELDGQTVYEGDVKILGISPFEIFPDSLFPEDLQDCDSIIHARAMPVSLVKEKYGIALAGEDVGVFDLTESGKMSFNQDVNKGVLKNSVVVIEKYVKPTEEYPLGRLITVAGGKLLYYGDMPYINGENHQRIYPFVKQESLVTPGSFFGMSIIERLIPVQRAYNAVKNRKHEFLNRLSTGVMTVEDGSVDTDDLAEEGLSPGKVLVYRQGSQPPEMMNETTLPSDFNEEENKLLSEFIVISGVPDISSTTTNTHLRSGTALELLVEQDNERLMYSAENIRSCHLKIARQTLKLYAQHLSGLRAVKYLDKNQKQKIVYVDKNTLDMGEAYLDGENEMLTSNSQKRDMVFRLYESGLLADEQGEIRPSVKEKVLNVLGYTDLDYRKGLSKLQEEKAQEENETIRKSGLEIEDIDDDAIHIDEHTRYILSEYQSLTEKEKQRLLAHVSAHKNRNANKNKEGE
jgi:hypothetical protein